MNIVDLIMSHGKMIISKFPRNLAPFRFPPCLGAEPIAPAPRGPWERNYFLDQGTRGPKNHSTSPHRKCKILNSPSMLSSVFSVSTTIDPRLSQEGVDVDADS